MVPSGWVTRTSIRRIYISPFPPLKCVMMVVEYMPAFSTVNESGHVWGSVSVGPGEVDAFVVGTGVGGVVGSGVVGDGVGVTAG
jgi:hypothetical protein